MARTAVTITDLTANGVIDIPAGTNVDPTNGHSIAITTNTIPSPSNEDRIFLYITNTAGADKTATVKAGVGGGATAGPAFRSGLGDLTVTIHTASGGGLVGPLESARFAQLDGSVNVDLQSGLTGKITAFRLPKNFG